ncbi:MAG TPA: hypothetical protein PLR99_15825 [Polyangiaceae bacterium]|nr:hypothetical protein [Polyangiaceae bacterium]
MTYRDAERAAAARIERLSAELEEARAGVEGEEEAARLAEETRALESQVGELRAELAELSAALGKGEHPMPTHAIVGAVLSAFTAFLALFLLGDQRAVFVGVPLGLVGVLLVAHGLFQTWRAGARARARARE